MLLGPVYRIQTKQENSDPASHQNARSVTSHPSPGAEATQEPCRGHGGTVGGGCSQGPVGGKACGMPEMCSLSVPLSPVSLSLTEVPA